MGREVDDDAGQYPSTWVQGDLSFPLTYRFDPGAVDDGVTVHVPVTRVGRVTADGFDWQVPGLRADLVAALVQTLPKDIRRQLIPIAETTAAAYRLLQFADEPGVWPWGRAVEAVVPSVGCRLRLRHQPRARSSAHQFRCHDETGAVIGIGKDLNELKRQLRSRLASVAHATAVEERRGITKWDIGDLPRRIDTVHGDHTVHGYPALLDDGDSVSMRVFTTARVAGASDARRCRAAAVARGAGRQARLGSATHESPQADPRSIRPRLPANLPPIASLRSANGWSANTARCGPVHSLEASWSDARTQLPLRSANALRTAAESSLPRADIEDHLAKLVSPSVAPNVADVRRHLARLVRDPLRRRPRRDRLADVLRYVNGIKRRLDKLTENPAKDLHKLAEVLKWNVNTRRC